STDDCVLDQRRSFIHVLKTGRVRKQRLQRRFEKVLRFVERYTARRQQTRSDFGQTEATAESFGKAVIAAARAPAAARERARDAQKLRVCGQLCCGGGHSIWVR